MWCGRGTQLRSSVHAFRDELLDETGSGGGDDDDTGRTIDAADDVDWSAASTSPHAVPAISPSTASATMVRLIVRDTEY
jgi:hypothetical protein